MTRRRMLAQFACRVWGGVGRVGYVLAVPRDEGRAAGLDPDDRRTSIGRQAIPTLDRGEG